MEELVASGMNQGLKEKAAIVETDLRGVERKDEAHSKVSLFGG